MSCVRVFTSSDWAGESWGRRPNPSIKFFNCSEPNTTLYVTIRITFSAEENCCKGFSSDIFGLKASVYIKSLGSCDRPLFLCLVLSSRSSVCEDKALSIPVMRPVSRWFSAIKRRLVCSSLDEITQIPLHLLQKLRSLHVFVGHRDPPSCRGI